MPKLRVPAEQIENRTIVANIKYGMEMAGVTTEEISIAMRTSTVTFYARLKNPGTFRLQELRAVGKKLHIPIEKLLQEA
jgi:hypothetical protein